MASDDEESDDEESDDEDMAADDTDLDNEPKGIDSLDADSDVDADVDADDVDTDADMDDMSADDDTDVDGNDDVMDMTGASDDEVMKVFKAMKPEDGIVVKKDGGHLNVNDGDNEYIIKLDDESVPPSEEETSEPFTGDVPDDEEEDESTIYEISLDEEETDPTEPDTDLGEEDDDDNDDVVIQADEAARTKSNPHGNKNGMHRAGLPSKKKYKAGSAINEEVETLKKQNGEYKKALVLFKDKLNEVAIFNANLAYFTRLVTEHSTTKQEKLNILKRFDSVSTMNESKSLFKTIESELGSKKPVTESVVNKISATPTTSSSQEVLAESKAYENPQFKRMKDLMSKIK